MQSIKETTAQRLGKTEQGRALLELLALKPSRKELADTIGASVHYINKCVRDGQVSKSGALLFDKLGIMAKEKLRPDLSADDWAANPAGLPIGCKCPDTGEHQILLRDLAIHFGSIRKFCEAAGIKSGRFHKWRTLNQISVMGALKLGKMTGLSRELRARVKKLT